VPTAQRDPAGEPVDRAEVHEGPTPRRLPEDRDGERRPAEYRPRSYSRERTPRCTASTIASSSRLDAIETGARTLVPRSLVPDERQE